MRRGPAPVAKRFSLGWIADRVTTGSSFGPWRISKVSIRGVEPDLNRVEINGVSQVSALGSRAGDFREIAAELFLSEGTVRNYTSAIFAKLNVSDRTQAVVVALRYGLVEFN